MSNGTSPADATLIDVLCDGFEKNEVLGGFHWRTLPMLDEHAARQKFVELCDAAQRWKGAPIATQDDRGRRLAAWTDLELRQAGRAIMVRVRAPRFGAWWHQEETWEGDPMAQIFDWLESERSEAVLAARQHVRRPP